VYAAAKHAKFGQILVESSSKNW